MEHKLSNESQCLFCCGNFQPPSSINNLSSHCIALDNPLVYVDTHFPDIVKGLVKLPEVKFYMQGESIQCTEPDLIATEHLNVPKGTIRNRQAAEEEEEIARKFCSWVSNQLSMPALVISGFPFQQYLRRQVKYSYYKFLEENHLLGETDVVCLTKTRGLFICEVKSTSGSSRHIEERIQEAWQQCGRGNIRNKIIHSDSKFFNDLVVHKMVALPNASLQDLDTLALCKKHKTHVICKDPLSSQETFDTFLENYLESKGLGEFSPYSVSNQNYKKIAARYITLCTGFEVPLSAEQVSKTVSEKVTKTGFTLKSMTPEQKMVLDNFSYRAGIMTKVTLNGHFGTGKTLLMQLGVRKLINSLAESDENHCIIFTSLGLTEPSGEIVFDDRKQGLWIDGFLKSVEQYLNELMGDCKNIKLVVGHLLQDVMNPLHVKLEREGFVTVNDIINTLNAAKNVYLAENSTLSNVHLFLDEVNSLNDDWSKLDQIAKEFNNVIWLGLDTEFHNEIEARLNLKYFEKHKLTFVLRNSKLITVLSNKIREYYWRYSRITPLTGAWPQGRDVILKYHPIGEQGNRSDNKCKVPKVGHCVDGLTPKFIILPTCTCTKVEELGTCKCMDSRMELALETSIRAMFKYDRKSTLKMMCDLMTSQVHISLVNGTDWDPISSVQNILRRRKIPYCIEHPVPDQEDNLSNCKIHLVQAPFILGREFDNMIYICCPALDTFYMNQFSNDLYNPKLLRNVSRAKCNFHIISPGGKETNRLRLNNLKNSNNTYINYDDTTNYDSEDDQWRIYIFSVINRFVLIHLLRDGAITLLPLPDQNFDSAIKMLKEGCLIDKLKLIKKAGSDIIQKRRVKAKFEEAFKEYAKGIIIVHRRLIGDYPWLRFDPLYDLGEHEEANEYLGEIKIYLNKLLINCAICLMSLGGENIGRALLILHFAVEDDTQGADSCWLYIAKCIYKVPDYPACVVALKKCLAINPDNQSALHLLEEANKKASESEENSETMGINIYSNKYNEMKNKFRATAENSIQNDPENFVVHNIEHFVLSNCRLQILNEILKPLSGFKKQWNLDHPSGIEYTDMYSG